MKIIKSSIKGISVSKGTPEQFMNAVETKINELTGDGVTSAEDVVTSDTSLNDAANIIGDDAANEFISALVDGVSERISNNGMGGAEVTHTDDSIVVTTMDNTIEIKLDGIVFDMSKLDEGVESIVSQISTSIQSSQSIDASGGAGFRLDNRAILDIEDLADAVNRDSDDEDIYRYASRINPDISVADLGTCAENSDYPKLIKHLAGYLEAHDYKTIGDLVAGLKSTVKGAEAVQTVDSDELKTYAQDLAGRVAAKLLKDFGHYTEQYVSNDAIVFTVYFDAGDVRESLEYIQPLEDIEPNAEDLEYDVESLVNAVLDVIVY